MIEDQGFVDEQSGQAKRSDFSRNAPAGASPRCGGRGLMSSQGGCYEKFTANRK